MRIISIIFGYLGWHYGQALISLTRIWGNFLFFSKEFFSLRLLFSNFFDPWKRMSDRYPTNFNIKEYFYAFITNIIVRVFGMIMRSFLIIIGLGAYVLLAILYPLIILLWILLPLITTAILIVGILLIIK
jgi:hypothetical protein